MKTMIVQTIGFVLVGIMSIGAVIALGSIIGVIVGVATRVSRFVINW